MPVKTKAVQMWNSCALYHIRGARARGGAVVGTQQRDKDAFAAAGLLEVGLAARREIARQLRKTGLD